MPIFLFRGSGFTICEYPFPIFCVFKNLLDDIFPYGFVVMLAICTAICGNLIIALMHVTAIKSRPEANLKKILFLHLEIFVVVVN